MTQPIEAAIYAISQVVAGVSGIVQAPNYPNETQSYGPFALTYFQNGTAEGGPIGTRRNLINISIDVLIFRDNLPAALATLTPLIDLVTFALMAEVSGSGQRFTNTISTFDKISIQLLPMVEYAGKNTIGYRFTMMNVKLLVSQ